MSETPQETLRKLLPLSSEKKYADAFAAAIDALDERERLRDENASIEEMNESLRNQNLSLIATNEKNEEEIKRLRKERDLAVAHDSQPYPTAEAYEAACVALNKLRAENEQLKQQCMAAIRSTAQQLEHEDTAPHEGCTCKLCVALAENERINSQLSAIHEAQQGTYCKTISPVDAFHELQEEVDHQRAENEQLKQRVAELEAERFPELTGDTDWDAEDDPYAEEPETQETEA